jgi:hypothetical protein
MYAQAAVVLMFAMKLYPVGMDKINPSGYAAGIRAMASRTGAWQVGTILAL